jgi:long-chain acyl-CoA synthetase
MFENYVFLNNNNYAAVTDSGATLTYNELDIWNKTFFNLINKRCLVFCLCSNTIGSLIGYVAFTSNKIVPLLLDRSIDFGQLKNLLELYLPSYIWLPKESSIEFENFSIVLETHGHVLLKTNFNRVYKIYDELALLFTTSGSTGSPKLVRISFNNLLSNTDSIIQYLNINSKEKPILVLPMNYSYGLSIINSHLRQGATILLTEKSILEKDFWNFLKNEKATSLSGVPYTFEILHRLRFDKMELPFLKTITQAGGKLNTKLIDYFSNYALRENKLFYVMYGQAEASPRMSYLPPKFNLDKLGSIGIAIPNGELYLINEKNDKINTPGEPGELIFKGKNVSLGYSFSGEDLIKGDENNGILFTGDIAQIDEDGFYYIIGRKKRFLKIFGNRVNLDHIEEVLKLIINECACVGVDDKLIIYITDDLKINDTLNYISEKCNIHKSAIKVRVLNEIPKNTSGKTIYSKLELE